MHDVHILAYRFQPDAAARPHWFCCSTDAIWTFFEILRVISMNLEMLLDVRLLRTRSDLSYTLLWQKNFQRASAAFAPRNVCVFTDTWMLFELRMQHCQAAWLLLTPTGSWAPDTKCWRCQLSHLHIKGGYVCGHITDSVQFTWPFFMKI